MRRRTRGLPIRPAGGGASATGGVRQRSAAQATSGPQPAPPSKPFLQVVVQERCGESQVRRSLNFLPQALKLFEGHLTKSTLREIAAGSLDLIINTVAASHDLGEYTKCLKRDGVMVLVGAPEHQHTWPAVFSLLMKRNSIAGSPIGGIAETQEMLDFCAEKGVASEIEIIPVSKINEAYERILKSDVRYRFVIDMGTL